MEEKEQKELEEKIMKFKQNIEEKLQQEHQEKIKNTYENEEKQEEIKLTEIINIKYYDQFELKTKIKDLILKLQDIYIVELKNGENTTYEIYSKDINHKIAQIDIKGKISFFDEKIDEDTTLEELEENNTDKNSFNFSKEELEEIEKNQEKEEQEKEDEEKTKEHQNKEQELFEDTEKSTQILEEELKLDKGDIRSCTKLKLSGRDNLFRNKVKECRQYDAVKLVYISSQESFRFVGLKRGQPPKFLETIEPSKGTMEKSIDINQDGSRVEKENIKGIMKFNGSKDYDFSVKIGQYGYIELSVLRKDPVTNKYISTQLETTTQRPTKEEVNKLMDKDKNKRIAEEVQEYEEEKKERGKEAKVDINDISDEGRKVKEETEKRLEDKGKLEKEDNEQERTLDENVKKYYY